MSEETDIELGTSHGTNKGLAIEWDFVALGGLPRAFDAARARLARASLDLTPVLFSRYLLGRPLEEGLARLVAAVGAKSKAVDAAPDIHAAFASSLEEAMPKPRAEVVRFVKDMAARGLKIGLMTQIPEETAKPFVAALDVGDAAVLLPEPATCVGGSGWDAWRRAPRKLQLADRMGVAIAVSADSARGALAAGLGVIALPDALTQHQDYTGADLVTERFTDEVSRVILELLRLEE
jgi:phosphoglycolate phosphatase-like HAD superfamily hydrolase